MATSLSRKIASRYLFSSRARVQGQRKGIQAIQMISWVTVLGISVGTAALVLVLAVFNGFETLLNDLFSHYYPDIKIESAEGKFFVQNDSLINELRELDGVAYLSPTIEEVAFFEYDGIQDFGSLKGVDSNWVHITHLDESIYDGQYSFGDSTHIKLVLGAGLASKLSLNIHDPFVPLRIYLPKPNASPTSTQPFTSAFVQCDGIFSIQQDIDIQYAIGPLDFAQSMIGRRGYISAVEISLLPTATIDKVKSIITAVLGDQYLVRSRYEQNEAFFKVMNMERWLFFAIISLAMILVALNLIGSIWMNVLEKKEDIGLLKAIGASDRVIGRIFIYQGLTLTSIGLLLGILLAATLYWFHLQYGLIAIPEGFAQDRYPMEMRWGDLVIVALTVLIIGGTATWLTARRTRNIPAMAKNMG